MMKYKYLKNYAFITVYGIALLSFQGCDIINGNDDLVEIDYWAAGDSGDVNISYLVEGDTEQKMNTSLPWGKRIEVERGERLEIGVINNISGTRTVKAAIISGGDTLDVDSATGMRAAATASAIAE